MAPELDDLGAADLADDDAVRPHAQGLAHEVAQRHGAGALEVGRPGLQADDVRVRGRQLAGVLDEQEPVALGDEAQQR